jgi:hypothetical protein
MMNLMDLFKIKNNLLVGRDAFISGDLFVSGDIISGTSVTLDCGTPTESKTVGVPHDR